MDTKFNITYKCRLCGEQFINGGTNYEEIAEDMLLNTITNDPHCFSSSVPRLWSHDCEDGNIGIADFIGIVRK